MKRLARAAEAWIWADAAIKLVGILALAGVMAAAWIVLKSAAVMLGL